MNASSPKPDASSTEPGKKFCACSPVGQASWKMTYCMMFMFATQTNPHTCLCMHTNAPTSFFPRALFYDVLGLNTVWCLCYGRLAFWVVFQFPLSFSLLYPRWHYHPLTGPQEPLRNHRSGCNVPFETNTNVGVIEALPTGGDQSGISLAHYRALLPYPHLSVFIPSSQAHIKQSPSCFSGHGPRCSMSVFTVRRTLSGQTEALQDFLKP